MKQTTTMPTTDSETTTSQDRTEYAENDTQESDGRDNCEGLGGVEALEWTEKLQGTPDETNRT